MYHRDYAKAITALNRFLAIEKAEFAVFRSKLTAGGPSSKNAERTTAARQGDAYTLLSVAYARSGDMRHAADAAAQARVLNPVSRSSTGNWRRSRWPAVSGEAAVALIEGAFVTSDGSLRKDLLDLYQRMGPGSCALKPGRADRPSIRPAPSFIHISARRRPGLSRRWNAPIRWI